MLDLTAIYIQQQQDINDGDDYVPYVPIKQRRLEKLHKYARQRRVVDPSPREENDDDDAQGTGPRGGVSLLDQAVEQRRKYGVQGEHSVQRLGSILWILISCHCREN